VTTWVWLGTRTERGGPASAAAIKAARHTLNSFRKALAADGEPLEASSISAKNYDGWVKHLLAADLAYTQIRLKNGRLMDHPRASSRQPMSAAKVAQHTGTLKPFSNLYVYKVMEYTRSDPLHRVDPYRSKPDGMPRHLDSPGRARSRNCGTGAGNGLAGNPPPSSRLRTTTPVTGVVDTVDKRRRRLADVNATGKRAIRDWLRMRPETESPQLFVQENGAALTKDGVRSLWRRIARKSGVKKGPHIARRTITKRALRAGEDPIKVQLMMGWASPARVLRYADEVAQETAAAKLVEYAPI